MATKKRRSTNFEKVTVVSPSANVISIDSAPNNSTGPHLTQEMREDGSPQLMAIFPEKLVRGKPWKQDLSFLQQVPGMTQPFAEAFIVLVETQRKVKGGGKTGSGVDRVKNLAIELKNGLIEYLISTDQSGIGLGEISTSSFRGMMEWLDAQKKSNGEPRWAEISRSRNYNTGGALVKTLMGMPKWKSQMRPTLTVPQGHWRGLNAGTRGVEVINRDLLTRIRFACIREVTQSMTRFREMQELCELHRGKLVPIRGARLENGKFREIWTAERIALYADSICAGGPLLGTTQLKKLSPDGAKLAYVAASARVQILNDIASLFHPTSRSIVPFVLLMAMALAYNPDTLRNSQLDDYTFEDELGSFFVANAFKGRANDHQTVYIPVDGELDNPAVLYRFLEKWTARIRAHADREWMGNLFIFTKLENGRVSAYNAFTNDDVWHASLKYFRREHGLEHFTLEQIRKSILDVTFEAFDGDIRLVQIQASHKVVETTSIYTSPAERARQHERIGYVMQLRIRHRETRGLIDPRNRSKEEDLNCATPGWQCMDPYHSPYSVQGKLCDKYGWCPICPLGKVKLDSPLTFAYSLALLDAINRGQSTMDPVSWFKRLGPIKEKLEGFWLPALHKRPMVAEAAKKLHIPILPIPE
jgi:hypothetical protein